MFYPPQWFGPHLRVSDASCSDEAWQFQMKRQAKLPLTQQNTLKKRIYQWVNFYPRRLIRLHNYGAQYNVVAIYKKAFELFSCALNFRLTFPAPVDTDKRARDNLAPPVVKFGTAQLERKKMLWVQPASFLQITKCFTARQRWPEGGAPWPSASIRAVPLAHRIGRPL